MKSSVVAAFLATAGAAPLEKLSVSCAHQADASWSCTTGAWEATSWVARAAFRASQNETGWATLFVESASQAADESQAYSAGYAEGILTAPLIYDAYRNMDLSGIVPAAPTQHWIQEQMQFMQAQVQSAPATDSYWQSVSLVLQQLAGMAAGYEAARAQASLPALSMDQILWIGMNQELGDISMAVNASARPDFAKMSKEDFEDYTRKSTHCSTLFRVTPDLSDLLATHTTWTNYIWLLRVYKAYTLRFSNAKAETMMFSGYPAALASIDDFFTTSQKLVIIETTNDVFNNSLYDYVVPQTVPYWVRVVVATRLATNAKDWHDIFYRYNSGTYNNQWMVADYKKFTPRSPLPSWTFSVSEQIPGPFYHPGEDMTDVLQRGHWPSYNVAYFKDVYEISGYPEMVKLHGYESSYQLAPRAKIFRRDAEKVAALHSMQKFIRENNWGTSDPLATDAYHAVAARGDLLLVKPGAHGATDAKIVNRALMESMAVSAISGPTTERQPPFSFTGRWAQTPHFGAPTHYNFDWQLISLQSMGAGAESHPVESSVVV